MIPITDLQDGLATLLGTNICPEVAGKVPLLPSRNHLDGEINLI